MSMDGDNARAGEGDRPGRGAESGDGQGAAAAIAAEGARVSPTGVADVGAAGFFREEKTAAGEARSGRSANAGSLWRELESLRRELREEREAAAALRAENDELRDEKESIEVALEKETSVLRNELEESIVKLADVEIERDDLQDEKDELAAEIEGLRAEPLQEQNSASAAQLEVEVAQLNEKLLEAEKAAASAAQLEVEVAQLNEKLLEAENAAAEARKDRELQEARSAEAGREAAAKEQALASRNQELVERVEMLTSDVKEAQEAKEAGERALKLLEASSAAALKEAEDDNKALTAQNLELSSKVGRPTVQGTDGEMDGEEEDVLSSKLASLEESAFGANDEEEVRLLGLATSLETGHMCSLARVAESNGEAVRELEALRREAAARIEERIEEAKAASGRRREASERLEEVRALVARERERSRARIDRLEGKLDGSMCTAAEVIEEKEGPVEPDEDMSPRTQTIAPEMGEAKEATELKEERNALVCQNKELSCRIGELSCKVDEWKDKSRSLGAQLESTRMDEAMEVAKVKEEKEALAGQNKEMSRRIEELSSEVDELKEANRSLDAQLECTKEKLGSKIASLQAHLSESGEEEDRLNSSLKSLEADHADALEWAKEEKAKAIREVKDKAQLMAKRMEDRLLNLVKQLETSHVRALARAENEKAQAIREMELRNKAMADRMEELVSAVEVANKRGCSLDIELADAKKEAAREQEQLGSKIASLEASLVASKEEEERLGSAMKALEASHKEALDKTQQQEQLGSNIASLEASLLASKQKEERMGAAMKALEASHKEALDKVKDENVALIDQNYMLCEEQRELNAKSAQLMDLLQEETEEKTALAQRLESWETDHANELARMEKGRKEAVEELESKISIIKELEDQKNSMGQAMERLTSELEAAKERSCTLSVELCLAKEKANRDYHRLSDMIVSLEASRQE